MSLLWTHSNPLHLFLALRTPDLDAVLQGGIHDIFFLAGSCLLLLVSIWFLCFNLEKHLHKPGLANTANKIYFPGKGCLLTSNCAALQKGVGTPTLILDSISLSWERCFGEGKIHVPLVGKSVKCSEKMHCLPCSIKCCVVCAAAQKMRGKKWAVALSVATVCSSISFMVCLHQRINLLLIWTFPIQRLHISSVLERTVSLRTFS